MSRAGNVGNEGRTLCGVSVSESVSGEIPDSFKTAKLIIGVGGGVIRGGALI